LPGAEITPLDRHKRKYYNACHGKSRNRRAALCASPGNYYLDKLAEYLVADLEKERRQMKKGGEA
jgi:hypothetical protein